MRIAFILFDGVTFLDFVGFYDVITRLRFFEKTKDASWDICAMQEEITDELGMTMKANRVRPDLSAYDLIFVPGGLGTRELRNETAFADWLKGAEKARYLVSVCTGSLLLGAAGFLADVRATTHPFAYDLLAPYCKEVVQARIVHEGNRITGGGVATSVDLGLYLVSLFLDPDEVANIKKQMDYPYEVQDIVVI
ncbi:DJ-1/PfpI family protein [Paenibacillus rhizovicinus]|uniref:DJ-1/PfpI family protein n=1 Tax=Paenibacillus rhizovicinus TaxID=2704463 RepID=A0A6C0NZY4_9BACL|nr:DJ-1/PfpI family protein [Paenibacillus rhizovicinus]QHW31681.1 DJ-1/PfpI family protein [Paenibacillus rhizovicinus]